MLSPCPKGWTRHASAFDLALCLLMAQDDLLRPKHPMRQALDDNAYMWLMDIIDPDGECYRLPNDLSALSAMADAVLETPAAGDLLMVFSLGVRAAYRRVAAEERAGDAAAAAVLWDWPADVLEEC